MLLRMASTWHRLQNYFTQYVQTASAKPRSSDAGIKPATKNCRITEVSKLNHATATNLQIIMLLNEVLLYLYNRRLTRNIPLDHVDVPVVKGSAWPKGRIARRGAYPQYPREV